VTFKVSGAGAFLGVGNGDPNCQEQDNKPKRSLFNGLAQLMVQSTKTAGEIAIEASAGSSVSAPPLTITTRPAMPRPSL
jgi:beta-galactosidase